MLKYREIKDAMDLCKMQEQQKVLVDKFFFLSVLEEVVRNRPSVHPGCAQVRPS